LAQRAKGDERKLRIAQRLRTETAVTLKWIAAELRWVRPEWTSSAVSAAEGEREII
jgi:hypothetical protein